MRYPVKAVPDDVNVSLPYHIERFHIKTGHKASNSQQKFRVSETI